MDVLQISHAKTACRDCDNDLFPASNMRCHHSSSISRAIFNCQVLTINRGLRILGRTRSQCYRCPALSVVIFLMNAVGLLRSARLRAESWSCTLDFDTLSSKSLVQESIDHMVSHDQRRQKSARQHCGCFWKVRYASTSDPRPSWYHLLIISRAATWALHLLRAGGCILETMGNQVAPVPGVKSACHTLCPR